MTDIANVEIKVSPKSSVKVDVNPNSEILRTKIRNVIYVSQNGDDAIADGTPEFPFKTIQAALDFIGDATNATEFRTPHTLLLDPGPYDENITIPKTRHISIMGLGTWMLGDGLGSGFDSTTPRNITFDPGTTDFGVVNVRPSLSLGVIEPSETSSTFIATSRGCHISGDIIFTDGGNISNTINLYGVKLYGDFTKLSNSSFTNLQMYRCYIKGALNAPGGSTILEIAESCEFDGLITVDGYNRLDSCGVDGGMTISTIFNTLPPSGMFKTDFKGTFTGPIGSLKIDPVTNFLFKANGASLGAPATKVILHDEVA